MIRFLAFLSSLFGPPPAIEAAVNAEWNCAFNASNAQAELARRGVRSRIDTVKIGQQEHAYVRAEEWVIDNGRLCGPSRVCLARDALYGLNATNEPAAATIQPARRRSGKEMPR